MTLLTPWGLLGLLGIAVLILIYIIRPNYQQKVVSSTYIWKLSLKYRKKRIPTNKLRNVLLIVCQILILASCAAVLAQPVKVLFNRVQEREVILVIDSSASMRAEAYDEESKSERSRFERAVARAKQLSDSVLDDDGIVSLIVADNNPDILVQRATAARGGDVEAAFETLLKDDGCAYGVADMETSMLMCEELIAENPNAEVFLYTDVAYAHVPAEVNVVDVKGKGEWNAAILNATATVNDNYYAITVDVVCYGTDAEVDLQIDILNANAMDSEDVGESITLEQRGIKCRGEAPTRVVFINADQYVESNNEVENVVYYLLGEGERIYSYKSIHISLLERDSFEEDNNFNIYDGQKQILKVQYASAKPNPFFSTILTNLRLHYQNRWDLQITEVKLNDKPALEGFDFYIFEHDMPAVMPTDGFVMLVNPSTTDDEYENTGIQFETEVPLSDSMPLTVNDTTHPLMKDILVTDGVSNITIQKYSRLRYDEDFEVLMTYNEQPVMLSKKVESSQVLVLAFSVHFSNFTLLMDFPIFMNNVFDYYMPSTVRGNAFEVNEKVHLNARGPELSVSMDNNNEQVFTSFPATLYMDTPGTYTLKQETYFGIEVIENIYVKIPAAESNIFAQGDGLTNPYSTQETEKFFEDLLLYIAAALVALIFIEWWLKGHENA